jgi:2-polyprenyl-6-methoxyphenol hydroxylase-like FAD-dependent oxidoreductase
MLVCPCKLVISLIASNFVKPRHPLHSKIHHHRPFRNTMSSPPPLKVLVSGSGIAGPCFAFWLNKFMPTAQITILERAPEPRVGGQAIDLRAASISIVERMGLLDKVREKTTTEVAMDFVYADGKTRATFPATGDAEQQSSMSSV